MKIKLTSLLTLLLLCLMGNAQNRSNKIVFGKPFQNSNPSNNTIRCISTEYESYLQKKNPNRATTQEFENWIAPKIAQIKNDRLNRKSINTVVTIPVVIHVIHNGDAYGTGENIKDEQVLSQITVLNQDYRRQSGTPGYNTNSIGADVEVEFCMAEQDPDGNSTNGIDRVNLGTASWATTTTVEDNLKTPTQWDPTRYFNIWVCRFSESSSDELYGVLGYAQFPDSSDLGGLDASGGAAETDGVVIGYQYFGSSAIFSGGTYSAPYDRGRTATHEIGHFFGLRHIWGDNSSCTVNATDSNKDYCPDTPAASTANYGCTAGTNSCTAATGNDMIENYMDYTDDTCMNIFTQDQKTRILAVLQNSPRRSTLTTSNACSPAQTYDIDGSLKIDSLNAVCETSFNPVLTLENKGINILTAATISYNFDSGTNQTFNWSGSLTTNQSVNINLPSITLNSGDHTINASITSINGTADQNSFNDSKSQIFTIISSYNTTQVVFNLQKDRYGSDTTWSIINQAGTTIASGGPYSDTSSLPALLTQNINVTNGECYTFTIEDAYSDGLCCTYGNGYYNLKTIDNTIIASGAEFASSESKTFTINTSLGINSNLLDGISIYPNPVKNELIIAISNENSLPESYSVYNVLGQIITVKEVTSANDLRMQTETFSKGIYIITIQKGNNVKTLKFIKE